MLPIPEKGNLPVVPVDWLVKLFPPYI